MPCCSRSHSILFRRRNTRRRSRSFRELYIRIPRTRRLLRNNRNPHSTHHCSKPCSMSFRLRSMIRPRRTEKGILRKLHLCKPLLQNKGLHHNYRNGRCRSAGQRIANHNMSFRLGKDLERKRFRPRCNRRRSSPPRCTLLSSPGFQR